MFPAQLLQASLSLPGIGGALGTLSSFSTCPSSALWAGPDTLDLFPCPFLCRPASSLHSGYKYTRSPLPLEEEGGHKLTG